MITSAILAILAMITATAPPSPDWIGPIAQYGPVGVVLAWFMLRAEPRLMAIEAAIDRSSRAQLSLAMASPFISQQGKLEVQASIKEIDDAIAARKP